MALLRSFGFLTSHLARVFYIGKKYYGSQWQPNVRTIQGEIVKGEGKIEHALGSDETNVLRVRFVRAGQENEITYLWQSDLDNYARLSGKLYQPGKQTNSPGMEALFIDSSKR